MNHDIFIGIILNTQHLDTQTHTHTRTLSLSLTHTFWLNRPWMSNNKNGKKVSPLISKSSRAFQPSAVSAAVSLKDWNSTKVQRQQKLKFYHVCQTLCCVLPQLFFWVCFKLTYLKFVSTVNRFEQES